MKTKTYEYVATESDRRVLIHIMKGGTATVTWSTPEPGDRPVEKQEAINVDDYEPGKELTFKEAITFMMNGGMCIKNATIFRLTDNGFEGLDATSADWYPAYVGGTEKWCECVRKRKQLDAATAMRIMLDGGVVYDEDGDECHWGGNTVVWKAKLSGHLGETGPLSHMTWYDTKRGSK